MGIPAGSLVHRIGYKGGMLAGFLLAAVGCALFFPAAENRSYGLFLGSLFVLASGIVLLQVAGNPYVAILGPARSAPARLTLTQAFNSLGTTIAPILGASLILSRLPKLDTVRAEDIDVRAVQIPYLYIAGVLVLISVLLFFLKLPKISFNDGTATDGRRAYHYRHLVLGMIGIFVYVGAEVAVGSHIVSYLNLPSVMSMQPEAAGHQVAFYWGGTMVGRFLGAYLLNKMNPGRLLAINGIGAIVLILISINTTGELAMWTLLGVGLMNSIMFATIFTLAVAGLGRHTEEASRPAQRGHRRRRCGALALRHRCRYGIPAPGLLAACCLLCLCGLVRPPRAHTDRQRSCAGCAGGVTVCFAVPLPTLKHGANQDADG